jgi:hypothetical protein
MPKITFIYAYEQETWSTPLSLLNEFKYTHAWDTEIVSIGSNSLGYYHDDNLKNWIESSPKTDIVLFMDWGRFDSPYLNKNLLPSAFWIQESGDDPQNWERNSPKCTRFSLTFTPDYDSYERYKLTYNNKVLWLTHFCDSRIHQPILNIDKNYLATTSRGSGNSQFLDRLTEHSGGLIVNQNGFIGIEHSKFLQSGLMVVQNSRWGEITRRIFEGMGCGQMVITDRLHPNKKLEELFTDGVDIVLYDNIVDCIEKINYYAKNNQERMTIANNGYLKVKNNHTQKQRVETLIQEWKEWKNFQLV